jgi:hypothetical protein
VGLASDDENGVINFRAVIATGCDKQHEMTGAKVLPIETYSSRSREWRRSKLVSDIPVAPECYGSHCERRFLSLVYSHKKICCCLRFFFIR